MPPLTFAELNALPTAVDLMTAARALGIGRTKAYQLAAVGAFPVRILRVGTAYHVPTAELLKVLGVDPTLQTNPPEVSEGGPDREESNQPVTVKTPS